MRGTGSGSKRWIFFHLVFCFVLDTMTAYAQQPRPFTPQSLFELGDARLEKGQQAWARSIADTRQVVDVVCLVPDRESFIQALGNWNDQIYFPILIDDTELTLKFLAEFRPRKVIRFPIKSEKIPDDRLWAAAMTGALRAILPQAQKPNQLVPGNLLWLRKEPRSPGLVLTKNDESAIAAAAMAAGRKQGMALWPEDKSWNDVLTLEEATGRAATLEKIANDQKIECETLGDELDFITITGDMPYRYQTPQGENCLDDLLGRSLGDPKAPRWAYTGRIRGTLSQQIYMVMCSLFLQPDNATLFNGYETTDEKFKDYPLNMARSRLDGFGLKTALTREGNLNSWRKAFFPSNESSLILVNSSGNPTSFNLQSGTTGTTWDVPWSRPTRIHIIHSFSAANAADPYTLAGRWLANGAYAYFGSVNEPYLQSFRTAGLLSDCLTQGYPWAAAVRQNPGREMFGGPWRLIVFGDPMMTLKSKNEKTSRINSDITDQWPAYRYEPVPDLKSDPAALLGWAVRQSIYRQTSQAEEQTADAKLILQVLTGMNRSKIAEDLRPIRDELLAYHVLETRQFEECIKLADQIELSKISPSLSRMIESAAIVDYQKGLSRGNLEDALPGWRVIVQICPRGDLRDALTRPLKPMTTTAIRKRIWIRTLERLINSDQSGEDLKNWAAKEKAVAESAKG